ncbi:MAG: hypothetical protein Q8Q89_00560 [bacterium]|nr:hypothetical protein [bacterium]
MKTTKQKILTISGLFIAIVVGGVYFSYSRSNTQAFPRVSLNRQEVIPSTSPNEPFLDEKGYVRYMPFLNKEGKKLLAYVESVPLPNGKKLYFGVLAEPVRPNPSIHCGSGGCSYEVYFGDTYMPNKPTYLKEVSGFDSYSLDCDTGKAIFYSGGGVFGSLIMDKANKVVRVYSHLNANLGSENIYHIADDGTPKLIASYSNECDDPMQPATSTLMLFRDNSYPNNLTAF